MRSIRSMSEQTHPGDWWLASDGRWYPPEVRPAPEPPAPPPPPPIPGYYPIATEPVAHPYSDEPGPPGVALRGWLQGVCWATAGLMLAVGVSAVVTAAKFQTYWTGGSRAERAAGRVEWTDAEAVMSGLYGLASIGWLAAIILMMVWMNKAHYASSRLWPGHRSWSAGWAVGGWFIPLANLVIPKLVLLEIERIARSVDTNGNLDPRWRTERGSAIGWWFWLCCVVSVVIGVVANGLRPETILDITEAEADLYVVSMVLYSVSSLLGAGGAMFGALHFRALGRDLEQAASFRTHALSGGREWAFASTERVSAGWMRRHQPDVAGEADAAVDDEGVQFGARLVEQRRPSVGAELGFQFGLGGSAEDAAQRHRQPFLHAVAAVDRVVERDVERHLDHVRPAGEGERVADQFTGTESQRPGLADLGHIQRLVHAGGERADTGREDVRLPGPPAGERQLGARRGGSPDVGERRHGILEEHHPEPRHDTVERRARRDGEEVVGLGVGHDDGRLGHPPHGGLDHRRRDVDADRLRTGGDHRLEQRAGAAPDVEHPGRATQVSRRHDRFGDLRERRVDDPFVRRPPLAAARPVLLHRLVRHRRHRSDHRGEP